MNDCLVDIDVDASHFDQIYPEINGEQQSLYYEIGKFNELSIGGDRYFAVIHFTIR